MSVLTSSDSFFASGGLAADTMFVGILILALIFCFIAVLCFLLPIIYRAVLYVTIFSLSVVRHRKEIHKEKGAFLWVCGTSLMLTIGALMIDSSLWPLWIIGIFLSMMFVGVLHHFCEDDLETFFSHDWRLKIKVRRVKDGEKPAFEPVFPGTAMTIDGCLRISVRDKDEVLEPGQHRISMNWSTRTKRYPRPSDFEDPDSESRQKILQALDPTDEEIKHLLESRPGGMNRFLYDPEFGNGTYHTSTPLLAAGGGLLMNNNGGSNDGCSDGGCSDGGGC